MGLDYKKSPGSTTTSDLEELVREAKRARESAYAPYSGFKVGAALRAVSGEIITGCNVENASYGLSICAERTAIVSAVARGHRDFDAIAVVTETSPPAPPCGQCLQSLVEFSGDMEVVLAGTGDERMLVRLHDLLPVRFELRKE